MHKMLTRFTARAKAVVVLALALHGGCSSAEEPTVSPSGAPASSGNAGASGSAEAGPGTPAAPGAPAGPVAGPSTNPGSATGLPCAVKKIVDDKCGACHSDPPVSTFMPLTKQAHFHEPSTTAPSKKYYELAKTRINAAASPMPPVTSPKLAADELATLNAWLEMGAAASSETCASTPKPNPTVTTEIDTTGLECHKFLAHADGDNNAKYKVGTAVDVYINFGFKAPWTSTAYGIVVKPVIDNAKVLHHWLLFKEEAEDGSVSESNGQHTFGEMVHGWAPGGESLDFRKHGDVSFELPASSYVVEVHYNSADANALDASGVEVCYQRAPTQHVAGLSWVGYDHGVESYTAGALLGPEFSEVCLDPQATWTGTCAPETDQPIHILFVVPHMHKAGVHMTSVINGPRGQRMLHDAPFDFSTQIGYDKDEVLMPGETITTTCKYSAPKCAGHATTAEMCYLFTYAYPKGALRDSGLWGQVSHGEGACLGQ
jgi:hypothetical protein